MGFLKVGFLRVSAYAPVKGESFLTRHHDGAFASMTQGPSRRLSQKEKHI